MAKEKKINLLKEETWFFDRFKSRKGTTSNVGNLRGNPALEITHFGKWA